jgi:hypothetical protein
MRMAVRCFLVDYWHKGREIVTSAE